MSDDVRIVINDQALRDLLAGDDGDGARTLLLAGVEIERRAKELCPVDTGRLRSSITRELSRDGEGLVMRVGTNVVYAPYVELGTSRVKPRPFLRAALASVVSRLRGA